jgi:hypothetical protein
MSNYDHLRAMREAQFEAKAKRALGKPRPVTKNAAKTVTNNPPVTENPRTVTENAKRARGRPRKPNALSDVERQRRHRAKPKAGNENAQ